VRTSSIFYFLFSIFYVLTGIGLLQRFINTFSNRKFKKDTERSAEPASENKKSIMSRAIERRNTQPFFRKNIIWSSLCPDF
jgi:hypothetical protein